MKRILAHYFSSTELQLLKDTLTIEEETNSFVIGTVDIANIKNLQQIDFEYLEDIPSTLSQGIEPQSKSLSPMDFLNPPTEEAILEVSFPGYFFATIKGPLLEQWKRALEESGIEFLEYVPKQGSEGTLLNYRYKTYLREEQYEALTKFPFVHLVEPENQLFLKGVKSKNFGVHALGGFNNLLEYDILLRSVSEMEQLLVYLNSNNIRIVGNSDKKIRVHFRTEEQLNRTQKDNPFIEDINPYIQPILHNNRARKIIGIPERNQVDQSHPPDEEDLESHQEIELLDVVKRKKKSSSNISTQDVVPRKYSEVKEIGMNDASTISFHDVVKRKPRKKKEINILNSDDSASISMLRRIPTAENEKMDTSGATDLQDDSVDTIPFPYEGEGQIVGIADTGIDKDHPDLKENILEIIARGRKDDASDPQGHGTHVAGSVAGTGAQSEGEIIGVAPQSKIVFQSLLDENGGLRGLPIDLKKLFQEAYDLGVRIHNNSWGSNIKSWYVFKSREVDEFVYNNKDFLIVVSAGNEGTAMNPEYATLGYVDYTSICAPASAKNVLTVGASKSDRSEGGLARHSYGDVFPSNFPANLVGGEKVSGDPNSLAAFSSRGPVQNNMVKPDVVAPGTDILSTKSQDAPEENFWGPYDDHYAFNGGTSMAAPIVTGFAVIIREYIVKNYEIEPSAALLKALIINGTAQLTGQDANEGYDQLPNVHQGFGLINLQKTLPNEFNPNIKLVISDNWKREASQLKQTSEFQACFVELKGEEEFRICLTWTDYPGNAVQNQLCLWLQHEDGQRWKGTANYPFKLFGIPSNVQILRFKKPKPGKYVIKIQAMSLLKAPQDYALVCTGDFL